MSTAPCRSASSRGAAIAASCAASYASPSSWRAFSFAASKGARSLGWSWTPASARRRSAIPARCAARPGSPSRRTGPRVRSERVGHHLLEAELERESDGALEPFARLLEVAGEEVVAPEVVGRDRRVPLARLQRRGLPRSPRSRGRSRRARRRCVPGSRGRWRAWPAGRAHGRERRPPPSARSPAPDRRAWLRSFRGR